MVVVVVSVSVEAPPSSSCCRVSSGCHLCEARAVVVTEDIEFSHEATVLLINGIRRRYRELSTNHRSRHQIYRDLHDEFTKHGYNYSVERIRRKWNNLLGTYKRLRKDPNPGKLPWEYLDMMSEFLPEDPCFTTNTGALPLNLSVSTPSQSSQESPTTSSAACASDASSVKVHVLPPSVGKDIELGVKRQNLMEKYMAQVKEKDEFEMEYKKRKERRERLKIRALRRIGQELNNIAVAQCEILKRQDQILAALQS
ncbi:uncharacterized protein LOC135109032 isoform X1 [Scylla paramamosain]|uniref:uncharacterized protein LOC135109032 isoform X1 n=1 Tax=Scylla paramamosain TaxID=85552 RepID=UPI003082750B